MHLKSIKQSFSVHYEYTLHFTNDLFNIKNPLFRDVLKAYRADEPVKLLFVLDDGVGNTHPLLIKAIKEYCAMHSGNLKFADCILIKGGEESKNDYENVLRVTKGVNDWHIDRHSFVVVIGGGAVIDMAGYAAAIAHRGVKLIRIPTTVLSQNDSAVGVKNSFNLFKKKNFLGTFAPPYAIINDALFLNTLEQRDWISGIAEAIKVALIKDAEFFGYIANNAVKLRQRDIDAMQYVIYKCAEMHMQHIAQGGDPFESGSSRPLDFGHWAAHKLEQMTNYELRHGEAVAKGIALDLMYAQLSDLITVDTLNQIYKVMAQIGFDLRIPIDNDSEMERLLAGIQEFREHLGGQLCITLIIGIGEKHDVHEIDLELMKKAVWALNEQCKLL